MTICVSCKQDKDILSFAKNDKNTCYKCRYLQRKADPNYRARKTKNDIKYYLKNKESIDLYRSDYRINQKNKNRRNTNYKYKIKNDQTFHLKENIRSLLKISLKRKNVKKNNNSFELLGYTIQQLKDHLQNLFEDWMNWNNHGLYNPSTWKDDDQSTWTWQVDHIKPQSDFQYTSTHDIQFKECWALNNLRPYSAKLNSIEGAQLIRHSKGK